MIYLAQSTKRWKRGHINTNLNNERQESGEFLLETYSNVNDNPQVALKFKVGSWGRTGYAEGSGDILEGS